MSSLVCTDNRSSVLHAYEWSTILFSWLGLPPSLHSTVPAQCLGHEVQCTMNGIPLSVCRRS